MTIKDLKQKLETAKRKTKKNKIRDVKKKREKRAKKGKSVNVNENTTTPLLPTTPYYIKSWGYYNKYNNIIIEQINPNIFIYNIDGDIGLAEVKEQQVTRNSFISYLEIKGFRFEIFGRLFNAKTFYNTPSLAKCEDFIKGKFKPRDYKAIQEDIKKVLREIFDFSKEVDIEVSSLTIGQSWIKPLLDNFFFYGVDATHGGGKTTIGEIIYYLMRHGFVGGDISSASLVRLSHALDLNIFVDEIDENRADEDIMAILRKGQRRGNPYVRCEGRDNHPVPYEIAGCHGFSFRSEVEDAFMSRSLRIHTTKSRDSRLPVINAYKHEVLKHLADELFFWFIKNIHVVGCSREKGCSRVFNTYNINRESIFNALTSDLNKEEILFLKEVFGRDNELSYLCLKTAKLLGIDMLESIKNIIQTKKSDSDSSEEFYLGELKELLHKSEEDIFIKRLKDGDYAGYFFYPKNRLYSDYLKHLKDLNVISIGTKKFSRMLRDLGFIEGLTIKSQRFGKYPSNCLIFNDEIIDRLELSKHLKPVVLDEEPISTIKQIEEDFS